MILIINSLFLLKIALNRISQKKYSVDFFYFYDLVNKNMIEKRTKGKSTTGIIREILKKYYVSTRVFQEFVDFLSASLNYDIPEIDAQGEKALKWKWEPRESFDLTPFYEKHASKANHNLINPDTPIKNGLSFDSMNRLRVLFLKEIPVKDIIDNFNISYPTLKKRVDPLFTVKTKNEGKAHVKYYMPKIEVFIALVNYYALEKSLKDNWNYFKQIYDIFK